MYSGTISGVCSFGASNVLIAAVFAQPVRATSKRRLILMALEAHNEL